MEQKKTTLRRELSFVEAIALSIGIMAPGLGSFSRNQWCVPLRISRDDRCILDSGSLYPEPGSRPAYWHAS